MLRWWCATWKTTLRKHFFFSASLLFWLFMVVGFSDNWLFDRSQASNADPKFLIHAFFSFTWFSLLVVQTRLVAKGNVALHQRVGVAGFLAYAGFFASTAFIYVSRWLSEGMPGALAQMNMAMLAYATLLVVVAIAVRRRNTLMHKTNMVVAAFMLMEPAISRTTGHLFGGAAQLAWLLIYLSLFAWFIWYFKKLNWQLSIALLLWVGGTANFIRAMA